MGITRQACGDFYSVFMKARRRRKNKNRKSSKNISTLLALLILALFIISSIKSNRVASFFNFKNSEEKLISAESLANVPLIPPSPTPTPSPSPTPTPVPLIGYCLNVPVLMYHHIQPNSEAQSNGQKALSVDNGEFDLQMGYLVGNGYTVISAQQLVDALINHSGLPGKSVVITMDDGYKDIYAYAYPILQKYHIAANLAVITGLVGGENYVSWGQVEEMSGSGLVNMLNHTWSHYSISQSSDKAKYEIATAKQQLQDHTGQNMDLFVYPYGAINSIAVSALQQEGIRGAFSAIGGHWQCDSFIMALHRTRIGNSSLSYYGL